MAKENKTEKKEVGQKEEAKEAKKPSTIASVFKIEAEKGAKDRKELASKILAYFKEQGIENNVKGKPILESRVLQQISAMLRDIKQERKGWWNTYTITENENVLKITPK